MVVNYSRIFALRVESWNLTPQKKRWISVYIYTHTYIHICKYSFRTPTQIGPGSSVGIATDYGLDGPGSNPGGDEIFRPSRPALGPTQPPVKLVPGISRG